VVLQVGRRTSDREVAGSTPARALLRNNLWQVVYTRMPLSRPSSIICEADHLNEHLKFFNLGVKSASSSSISALRIFSAEILT